VLEFDSKDGRGRGARRSRDEREGHDDDALDLGAAPARASLAQLQRAIRRYVHYTLAKQWKYATTQDLLRAVSLATRERVIDQLLLTERRYREQDVKRLYYLSMEFLMGRSLVNNLVNLGVYDLVGEAVRGLRFDFEEVVETEQDAALGNGGLGRLAACFLDSLASMSMPGYGYGINYEFGLFRQAIWNGYQQERPDAWGYENNPWLIHRPESRYLIPVYGRVEHGRDRRGKYLPMWLDCHLVVGVAHDMPIIGYGGETVNLLRLFSARASDEFDIGIFNAGDYIRAVEDKIQSERITKVLYPSDSVSAGRELRLLQEYFLVACAIRDIFRRFRYLEREVDTFPDKVAIQLNDTHPSLAVPEMMRLLLDENDMEWDRAWSITQRTLGFTNHTLLPEALERWPVTLLEKVLPRHLQIIYEINRRLLGRVAEAFPGDNEKLRRVSIVDEGDPKHVRMAHLAIAGSHAVNGVASLHSELLRSKVFPDFHELWPKHFQNKTNGVTQRRWLLVANPGLAALLKKTIGDAWITDFEKLRDLEPFARDASFLAEFRRVKQQNKLLLSRTISDLTSVETDPASLFDIQAKRIHLYKRQLLHVLFVIHEYLSLARDGKIPPAPRTHIFAGKAAPGYAAAKLVIKLIHSVADVVNHDKKSRDHLHVVFLPDYRVSLAERVIPSADLSEQISTAGMEASGTGNMKFAMNGALTIGTLDGANIEIREEVGNDNIFIFGLRVDEVAKLRAARSYNPGELCDRDPRLKRVVESLGADTFCAKESGIFEPIRDWLLDPNDEYFHLADLAPYIDAQELASALYRSPDEWTRKAVLNVARMGPFSSDRTIREYARDIWNLKPTR
jgi:starch phosphorylase